MGWEQSVLQSQDCLTQMTTFIVEHHNTLQCFG